VIPFTKIKRYNAAVVNAQSDVTANDTFSRSAKVAAEVTRATFSFRLSV